MIATLVVGRDGKMGRFVAVLFFALLFDLRLGRNVAYVTLDMKRGVERWSRRGWGREWTLTLTRCPRRSMEFSSTNNCM